MQKETINKFTITNMTASIYYVYYVKKINKEKNI
jgi:hypothetical protein